MDIHELMDLKVDYAFKQLFGHQKNTRVLITFLNSILNRTLQNRITAVQLENTELSPEYADDKMSRLDVLGQPAIKQRLISKSNSRIAKTW